MRNSRREHLMRLMQKKTNEKFKKIYLKNQHRDNVTKLFKEVYYSEFRYFG